MKPLDNINIVWNRFSYKVVPTDRQDIAVKDEYYIYGIPKEVLDRNPKLEQNNNWGGAFNPYL